MTPLTNNGVEKGCIGNEWVNGFWVAMVMGLLRYATFKVRKFESFFYKINTSLKKITTCIGLQAEQIFSVINI